MIRWGCEHGAMLHNEVVLRFCLSDQDSRHTVSHNYQRIGVGLHGTTLHCLCPAHSVPLLWLSLWSILSNDSHVHAAAKYLLLGRLLLTVIEGIFTLAFCVV